MTKSKNLVSTQGEQTTNSTPFKIEIYQKSKSGKTAWQLKQGLLFGDKLNLSQLAKSTAKSIYKAVERSLILENAGSKGFIRTNKPIFVALHSKDFKFDSIESGMSFSASKTIKDSEGNKTKEPISQTALEQVINEILYVHFRELPIELTEGEGDNISLEEFKAHEAKIKELNQKIEAEAF